MKFSQIFVIAMAVLLLLSGCSEVPRSVSQPSEGKIETDTGLFFDAQTLSLTFGEDTFIVYGEEKVAVGGTVHDISFFADGDTIYFDPISKRITSVKYDNSVVLGEYHTPLYQCKLPVDMSQVYINDLLAATMEKLHDYKVVCLGDDLTE
ncbi:MAG: hypothetical protein IJB11_06185, partial [Oscillospiraceae bacterium]|nr:hypothetical protein [Oscillospiraceae bacterium]